MKSLDRLSLNLAFALTGVATAVLGAVLPAMLIEWRLDDRGGGSLLLSAFAGSTLGALLVHRSFRALAAGGLLGTALATLFLAGAHGGRLVPAFFLYGIGLGLTMTAVSLLRSREIPAAESSLEMNRLNLFWAVGACCAPALALRSLHIVSVRTLFRAEAVFLTLPGAWIWLLRPHTTPSAPELLGSNQGSAPRPLVPLPPVSMPLVPMPLVPMPLVPLRLCIFAAAAVGVETALGGWLTTYTERVAHGVGVAAWANFAFWMGLLLSRAAHSLRAWSWVTSERLTVAHLVCVAAALILLVVRPSAAALPIAASLAGLGLGPLYPLALSRALPHYRSSLIFVISGIGSAVLPWLTGALSAASGSLRTGLLAPCAAVGVLLLSAASVRQSPPSR